MASTAISSKANRVPAHPFRPYLARCGTGYHVPGVCAHPGSKAAIGTRKSRNRAANKVARASRKRNRS